MLTTTIIETFKMFGHFIIPLILMIIFKQARLPILVAVILAFGCVSAKEVVDLNFVSHLEYDDLSLNALGAVVGALV